MATDVITSSFVPGGEDIADDLGMSPVGRPATQLDKLWNGFLYPSEYGRAAWQVYSGIFEYGGQAAGQAAAELAGPILDNYMDYMQ